MIKLGKMDKILKRRFVVPKRTSELVALIAISATLFLFLHTRDLNTRLREMEIKMQPDDLEANQIISGDSGPPASDSGVRAMMKILQSTGEMSSLQPWQLNNTPKAEQEMVFFNRVPKVGSQTFIELFRELSERNNFALYQDQVQRVETIRLAPEEQARLASLVSSFDTPGLYVKHVCFTNFSEFNLPQPIYVNLVRDPVERVISWYYYIRAPWYYVERKMVFPDIPLPDPRWLKKDYEECVLSGDRECQYNKGETREGIRDHRRQSMFFCGHGEICTPFNTQAALQSAKRAVEQHYAVVGLLEDLNSTFTVLEHYVPRFFAGASDVYWNVISKYHTINKNSFKPPVSEHVKDIVRRNFTREIEFYQFCKQRLHKQLIALRLPEKP